MLNEGRFLGFMMESLFHAVMSSASCCLYALERQGGGTVRDVDAWGGFSRKYGANYPRHFNVPALVAAGISNLDRIFISWSQDVKYAELFYQTVQLCLPLHCKCGAICFFKWVNLSSYELLCDECVYGQPVCLTVVCYLIRKFRPTTLHQGLISGECFYFLNFLLLRGGWRSPLLISACCSLSTSGRVLPPASEAAMPSTSLWAAELSPTGPPSSGGSGSFTSSAVGRRTPCASPRSAPNPAKHTKTEHADVVKIHLMFHFIVKICEMSL